MRWIWNEAKNQQNKRNHGLGFETAQLVFDDSLAVSCIGSYPDEERWQTVGAIDGVIVLVVHTWPLYDPNSDEEIGQIISARKATKGERRAYEEGDF